MKSKIVWEFYKLVNDTWEYIKTEENETSMIISKKFYQKNSNFQVKVIKIRKTV